MNCKYCEGETTRGVMSIGAVCLNPICEAEAIGQLKDLEHDQLIQCPKCGYSGWQKGYLPFTNCPQCEEFLFITDKA